MVKISEVLLAIQTVDRKITLERKKGTMADKVAIRKLQSEYQELSRTLATLHEDDRVTPRDKKDDSGEKLKQKQFEEQEAKKEEDNKKMLEELARKKLSEEQALLKARKEDSVPKSS